MIEPLIWLAQQINRDLDAQHDLLFHDLNLSGIESQLRALADGVARAMYWHPQTITIPPSAGPKPCSICGRTVGLTEDRFKVPLPPGSGMDLSGHGAGIYVGSECVEAANGRVMENYPNARQVERLVAELGAMTAELTDRGEPALAHGAQGITQALRKWMGWTEGEQQ